MLRINGVLIEPIGEVYPICPTCGVELAKFPLRKISCPHCGESIFSRSQPFDGKKRLVNIADARRLEGQWESFSKLKDIVARLRCSPMMQQYLHELKDGQRGMADLHPDCIRRCLERLVDTRMEWNWVDPPAQRFDPHEVVDVVISE